MKQPTQRGAVLVVSLIMLALVTFIVIAYLSFSQRERTSVNMSVIQAETRFVLEIGTAMAQAVASGKVAANENYQLMTSENMDGAGQVTPYPPSDPQLLTLQNSARPPVHYDNDKDGKLDELRYFLDLNRDGVFQPASPSLAGDPQWIGVLADPGMPHGADNRFIGRYAYMIVPASKTLDLNHVHNNAKNLNHAPNAIGDMGFVRSTGWSRSHLNLAATLGALDPSWDFRYEPNMAKPSVGLAFYDAGKIFHHVQSVGTLYDPGDFLTPFVVSTPDATYEPFNKRLRQAGGSAFYELAASVSTLPHRVPMPKLNLNHFATLRVEIDILSNSGDIHCLKGHGLTNGARVTLYGDTGAMPAVLVPNGQRLISQYDDFFAQIIPQQGANDKVTLHWDFNATAVGAAQFGLPVTFAPRTDGLGLRTAEAYLWQPTRRYARNDLAYAARPNGQSALYIAMRDHVAGPAGLFPADLAKGYWTEQPGNAQSAMVQTQFYLDRRRAMFENVAVALLHHSTNVPRNLARTSARNDAVTFNIPLDESSYTPEVQRLFQVAANICDIYTPTQFPSVFRPLIIPDANGTVIRRFAHEPNRSFLGQQLRVDFSKPAEAAKFANDYQQDQQQRQIRPDIFPFAPRPSHIVVDGKPAAVPVIIGAKKAWPSSNGLQLAPAINEILLHSSMGFDNPSQLIVPRMRLSVETKRFDDGQIPAAQQIPLALQIAIKNEGNVAYRYHHGTTLADGNADNRDYTFSNATEKLLPAGRFHVESLYGPLYKPGTLQPVVFRSPTSPPPAAIPSSLFDRWPWEIGARENRIECSLATPEDPKDGRKGILVDHVDLNPNHYVDSEPIDQWRPDSWAYKAGDEVIRPHNDNRNLDAAGKVTGVFLTTNRYVARKAHSSSAADFDYRKPGVRDGLPVDYEVLDPKLWLSEIWEPKEMYRKGDVLKLNRGSSTNPWFEFYIAERGHFAAALAADKSVPNALDRDVKTGNLAPFAGEVREICWQANDPLLNSRESDILPFYNGQLTTNNWRNVRYSTSSSVASLGLGANMGAENFCYQPWSYSTDARARCAMKDAGLLDESYWEFPTRGLGNIGELGLLHRGTPWQSINLKAIDDKWLTLEDWRKWVAPSVFLTQQVPQMGISTWDSTSPTADLPLLEAFAVTDIGDDLRGLLSVNQVNRAAWASALAGVAVTRDQKSHIGPNDGKLGTVVGGINRHRMNLKKAGPFTQVVEVLGTPELSVASPYLPAAGSVTDWDYEAIPRQTLSLLRVEDDHYFIAYVYSQALRPAQGSRPRQLCSNYEVVGETAARSIFRVEQTGPPFNGVIPVRVVSESWAPFPVR